MKLSILSFSVALISVAPSLPAQSSLLNTFTNPAPAIDDYFGWSVAAVGTDKVLIGAPNVTNAHPSAIYSGSAYLHSIDGLLLITFTNPTPASSDYFGNAVAGIGADKVLIGARGDNAGASDAGAAYIFGTNGTLLTTLTNPFPAIGGSFGWAVAAMDTGNVIIGAPLNRNGSIYAGAAYLYAANGTLLTTFTNPTPADFDEFGSAVAGVGADKVLISADHGNSGGTDVGVVYLYSTNGGLLTTFTNPMVWGYDHFGKAIAAVGVDKVLIGAEGAVLTGTAHLFSIDGELLNTFTNPVSNAAFFGRGITVVGNDQLLFGAYSNPIEGGAAGAAHLYSINGMLQTTFTNPKRTSQDYFGWSVAAVGADKVLIGAYGDSTGATNAGAAYLFSVNPHLRIFQTTTNSVVVAWPAPSTGWKLQANPNLGPTNWKDSTNAVNTVSGENQVVISSPSPTQYYRLIRL